MDTAAGAFPDAARALFDGLSVPVCLVRGDGTLVALNRAGLSFWGVPPAAVLGRHVMDALRIVPADGEGDVWGRLSAPGASPRLACRVMDAGGGMRSVSIIHAALATEPRLSALIVIDAAAAEMLADLPEWALRDPVTGLGNRHLWEREREAWDARCGCIAFLDLDDLKEVNDLYGHVAGDRLLAAVGAALRDAAPAGSLAVRYGGDEFVVLLPWEDGAAAEAWAEAAVRRVEEAARRVELPVIAHLSHGVAAFGPGGLAAAVQRADDLLYERKGVLLPARGGGRIILTRRGRAGLRRPGDDAVRRPGAFAAGFGEEFEATVRAQYARAAGQAREFVAFVAPAPATAVVEVGAGAGRVTFDGGLAERVGPEGQLLVTDASFAQLQAARRRAEELGLEWIRFLQAPAEDLPLASGTVDLALGALFLQFTDAPAALREMARIVRPGGAVAVSAGLAGPWPPLWEEILAPVCAVLDRHDLPLEHFFTTEEALRAQVAAAGLEVCRTQRVGPDRMEFPDPDLALAFWRQNGLVRLLLRRVADPPLAAVEAAFEQALRAAFARSAPHERTLSLVLLNLVAVKPARPRQAPAGTGTPRGAPSGARG